MGEGDGVYYSGSAYAGPRISARRDGRKSVARRVKKAAVALVGLGAVGGGAYFAATMLAGHSSGHVSDGPAALAPVAPSPSRSGSPSPSASAAPEPDPQGGTRNAVRQAARPSPTPSVPDDQVAAAQVSGLLAASPQPVRPGMAIAGGPLTVSNETGTDGSSIRVVAAHYDLTGRWSPGDAGQAVGDATCTRKLAVAGRPAEDRPSMVMCWRFSPGKSVVTVASRPSGRPLPGASVDVLDQIWQQMG